jgi:hypothetical protein
VPANRPERYPWVAPPSSDQSEPSRRPPPSSGVAAVLGNRHAAAEVVGPAKPVPPGVGVFHRLRPATMTAAVAVGGRRAAHTRETREDEDGGRKQAGAGAECGWRAIHANVLSD